MSAVNRDQFIGKTLDGRYHVRARIARGGMGMVYLADDLRLGRRVAVKAMHAHLVDDDSFLRRFEKEAQAAARLNDQNVVNVFDQGLDGDVPYLVMEYVPGITLRELLKQQKRLTAAQAIEISEAVLSGLSAAHQAGFIHRDVKPENVFLADDGRIKIGDFGLARAANNNTTTGQALLGTIAYLSPELVTRGVGDTRTDVYAFGIMLYEMLTGVQPFRGEQAVQVAYMHAHQDVPKPSLISREASPELDELVRWTTARDPEKRPRDATIVLARMRELLDGGLHAPTRVLPSDGPGSTRKLDLNATAATTVLGATAVTSVAPAAVAAAAVQEPTPAAPAGSKKKTPKKKATKPRDDEGRLQPVAQSPIERAQALQRKRSKRGAIVAAIALITTVAAGAISWYTFQGPGALKTVPQVLGLEPEQASNAVTAAGLIPELADCTNPTVAPGLISDASPAPDTRVPADTTVKLCQSIGPASLPVPTLVGLSSAEAEKLITEAGFTFDGITSEVFDGGVADTVLAAFDADGNPLGAEYREQGPITLVLSAGPVPNVSGLSATEAKNVALSAKLNFDESLNSEASSEDIESGRVIALAGAETLRVGDSVGLIISTGPELFAVPDVTGLRMNEAIKRLEEAGFKPLTGVPQALRNAVHVKDTKPAAGEKVRAGSEVELGFEL
ncbi:Stk1 family PASTA domain-containing Ser/Thr kinase [Canibacter zhoujuaniae]|uniref:Stk1 family PASTA domain-containing Ser/Thr kinase n=1 Tax=Canibacter zhoujuaniae TaxID=2708343 RepID=UPI001FBA19BE|nr:Stk1 family PASTA domain-containing Ser/Thr kinase [Canibacter zhoujuaniae]